jgi:hypothetical protein
MKNWVLLFSALGGAANAQITSITDPSALRMDVPAKAAESPVNTTAPIPQPVTPPTYTEPANSSSAATADATSGGAPLNISCGGAGSANKVSVANAFGWSRWGSSQVTAFGTRSQGFEDQVDVRLFSGDDRIRLPRTMLPPIHGGSDGWFKLKDVKVTDRAIQASAGVNFMNNPKIHIDRMTGTISINGKAGSYSGQCQAMDPNAQRKF